ncbi:MAG: cupin domain-containing protein [Betaproteobacteria bacterium]
MTAFDQQALAQRLIAFDSLRYSTEAFIDYRIPECSPKYNYALIGPGVSQNPNQPISLRERHGFQVGGVSMPHGKMNPPHLHFTCEVFICVRGEWEIMWGFNPGYRSARIRAGDIISVPTWIYRGFRNVGIDDGFMFTALGGDDTGGILWGPTTLAAAAANGLHLTDDYRIIDEHKGEKLAPPLKPLEPMTDQEIAALRDWSEADMLPRIVRGAGLRWSEQGLLDSALPGAGAQLAPVIGLGISEDRDMTPPIANSHGVSIEWLAIPEGGRVGRHRLADKQVVIAVEGDLGLEIDSGTAQTHYRLKGRDAAWDSYALPAHVWRCLTNRGAGTGRALLLTSGDHRKRIDWAPEVTEAASRAGWAHDANGHIALKRFTDRSQR